MGDAVQKQSDRQEAFISFRCKSCGQEIEAHLEMAGTATECPACGNPIQVPLTSEPGTLWGAETKSAAVNDKKSADAMKGRTIRIELSDDF